jgi:biotin-dependent carboxylase-like uncharacterized protein
MATAHVIKPGMLTTIQDLGRWGFQARGVPVAGPMDVRSHRLANALVGNPADAATLEVTITGPELEFDAERIIAVTGAEFDLSIDGHAASFFTALPVASGSRLSFGRRRRGARAYVAVSGGFDVPPVLGSRATSVVCGMGGFDGRPLRSGDRLPLGEEARSGRRREASSPLPRPADRHARVRVLPGPQQDRFTADALDILQAAPYTIDQQSDRMGFRLLGQPLTHRGSADVISDATAIGSIQVPASGLPILLMADRQTSGGYAKLATAITADLPDAAQLSPGDTISFVVCSPTEALSALIAQERALMIAEGWEQT